MTTSRTVVRAAAILALWGSVGCSQDQEPDPEAEGRLSDIAAHLGAESDRVRKEAIGRLAALEASDRVQVLRKGLRLANDVAARECALRLRWDELDTWESQRVAGLLLETTSPDWSQLAPILASSDVPAILALPDEACIQALREVASLIRPEHFALARERGGEVAELALAIARDAGLRSDSNRAQLAAYEVGHAKPATSVAHAEDRAEPSGFPTVLGRYLRTGIGLGATPGALERWAMECSPVPADLPLLLALSRQDESVRREIAIRGMSQLRDQPSKRRLTELASEVLDDPTPLLAAGALALRGESEYLTVLRHHASAGAPLALAALLHAAPEQARRLVESQIYERDEATRRRCLRTLRDARQEAEEHRLEWDPGLFLGFATRGLQAGIDGVDLVHIALAMPVCQSRSVARAAISRLLKDSTRAWEIIDRTSWRVEADESLLFLERHAPRGLRRLLRAWANDRDLALREVARSALLTIGDPRHGDELVRWVSDHGVADGYGGNDLSAYVLLARSPHPATERFLKQAAEGDRETAALALGGLAAMYGIDDSAAMRFAWRLLPSEAQVDRGCDAASAPTAAEFEAIREIVLDQRPVDAVVQYLGRHTRQRVFLDVGLIRDARLARILRSLRDHREHRMYAWITGQLALMGDADARREIWSACVQGRRAWIDTLDVRTRTLNHDLQTIPFWVEQLDSNRQDFLNASVILASLYGMDLKFEPRLSRPPAELAREWWTKNRASLVWSRLADRFVRK
jgi:hypothetical protein